jgi:flagellar protein FlgJ
MDVATLPSALSPELARRADIRETAQKFEASFLAIMLQQMFEGVEPAAPFDGGPGEAMFKSFMTEAMAKQVTKAGGIGVTDTVAREMLKLQGLE